MIKTRWSAKQPASAQTESLRTVEGHTVTVAHISGSDKVWIRKRQTHSQDHFAQGP